MMKRIGLFIVLFIALNLIQVKVGYSLQSEQKVAGEKNALMDIRREIFEESKVLKEKLTGSKDVILLSSMWDACVMAVNQIDAYFMMIGILNTIERENWKEEALYYIAEWLKTIKKTSELNLKNLKDFSTTIAPDTEKHVARFKDLFNKLSAQIDVELQKINTIKTSLKVRNKK